MTSRFTTLFSSLLVAVSARAADYYVDFDGGSDAAAGTATNTAFKHCPGDPNATGTSTATTPGAGDTVHFKGGVYYRGIITIKAGGTDGSPVTYIGSDWGASKAIIDGSDIIAAASWTNCASAADVGGNTNWAHIYYTVLPALPAYIDSQKALTINIYQDLLPVPAAQYPLSLSDYYMTPSVFLAVDSATATTITAASLSPMADGIANFGYVYVYYSNEEKAKLITSWDGVSQIGFASTGTAATKFALVNSTNNAIFNQANQYVYEEATGKLWVWPRNEANLASGAATVTYSLRPYGFHLNQKNFVVIDGFIVQKQTGPDTTSGTYGLTGAAIKKASSGLCVTTTIRNCEVTGCYTMQDSHTLLMDGAQNFYFGSNYVHDTRGRGRGVYAARGTNTWVTNNTFINVARTVVFLQTMTNSFIGGNILSNCNGVHGNGISVYTSSDTSLVASNKIYDSNIGITCNQSGNITIVNNFIDRKNNNIDNGSFNCATWGSMWGINYVLNNTFVRSPVHYAFDWEAATDTAGTKYVVENNIFDGGMVTSYAANSLTNKNNWFTGLSFQQGSYSYGSGEFLNTNIVTNFVASSTGDFRLSGNSVAKDVGLDLSVYGFTTDILGVSRGGAWDLGAYEYLNPSFSAGTVRAGRIVRAP